MFKRIFTFSGLVLSLLIFASLASASSPPPVPSVAGELYAPDRILVRFAPGVSASTRTAIHRANGAVLIREIPQIGVQVLRVPTNRVPEMVTAYSRNPNVLYAEPDYVAYALEDPDDSYFTKQWGLDNDGQVYKDGQSGTEDADIDAPEAWDITTGNSNIVIAILDSGIDQDHEDLASKIVANADFTGSGVDDRYGHGTHVAGIAAAATNNDTGVAGVGYNSSLLNVKVLNNDGIGYDSWIANGIVWATNHGAKVINMSLGGKRRSSALEDAVNHAWTNGVVVVAAAGNDGNPSPNYPAKYENCIAVAATDDDDAKAGFSNYGDWVDVAAPGLYIYSTFPNHPYAIGKSLNYDYGSGTSMSTPHVAGLAALVWATGYGTSNQAVRDRIELYADPITGTGTYWIHGRINACQAVGGTDCDGPVDDPPSVTITNPKDGDKVSGIITVTANATDDNGVTRVEFFVDGSSIGTDTDGSDGWSISWDTPTVADGSHTVTTTATDTIGQTASDSISVTVDNINDPPVASFTYTCSGLTCDFDGSGSSDPDGTITTYAWGFGDGKTGFGSIISHTYANVGTYSVKLTVTDDDSAVGTDSQSVTVSEAAVTMHVGDLDGVKNLKGRSGNWEVFVTVTIHDDGHGLVAAATVYGTWSGAHTGSVSGTTDSSGTVTFTTGTMKGGSSVTFTVDEVEHVTLTYDAANHDPDGDSDGTTITVTK